MLGPETGDAARCCRACGLDYASELDCCPHCGARSSARQSPLPEFRPVRGLAKLLIVALAFVTAMVAAMVVMRELGLGGNTWNRGFTVTPIDKITDVTMLGLGFVFVMWFYSARASAEHRGWPQRRARAWTFWGWIVPIVGLWIPFQLMGDIWRAGLPADRRGTTAWLPVVWWSSFLLSGVTVRGPRELARAHYMPYVPQLSSDTSTFSMCMLVVSGLALIAIIRSVSYGPVGTPDADRFASAAPLAV